MSQAQRTKARLNYSRMMLINVQQKMAKRDGLQWWTVYQYAFNDKFCGDFKM